MVHKYKPKGFHIKFRGKTIELNAKQEEMAVAWVKKLGTDYVNDSVFVKNFFNDFCKVLGIKKAAREDFDFSEIERAVEAVREKKLNMSKEEKKALAAGRKTIREANKEKYGYAEVDGKRVEISNYVVEPRSIFMGRGKHPLKHVWISEASHIRQKKEIDKFEKAKELAGRYNRVKAHIIGNLSSADPRRRKIATVCYLIDALNMRVGDEKDKDEADTVGATTLTKKNIKIKSGNIVEFDFIGKDFVRLKAEAKLPAQVITNLKDFMSGENPRIFNGVRSETVSLFLDEVAPGMSSKVFRTYHSTKAVGDYLKKADAGKDDSEARKKHAAKMANLQAAIICNHKRKLPKRWKASLDKKKARLKKLRVRMREVKKKREERLEKLKLKKTPAQKYRKAKQRYKERMQRLKLRKEKLKLQIKTQQATRDFNLNTSLKSYIDPRVYKKWFDKVGFDWKGYYPKTLQKKFSWIEKKD